MPSKKTVSQSKKETLPKKKMVFTKRKLSQGLGKAVAKRTYLRTDANGKLEKWSEVAKRVALGNTALIPEKEAQHRQEEYEILEKHIANASLLLSGRHLQHGDKDQPTRNMEVFTNCSTASTSYLLFYLLLNGSGVGRSWK